MTGPGHDARLVNAVEHVDDVEVGELLQPEERVGLEPLVEADNRLDAPPVVVDRLGPAPDHGGHGPQRDLAGHGRSGAQEQPLVVPQLVQTKQLPARCMALPHW